ncbi:hypothetical protein BJY04DRAFT_206357 [Aspergillus karnatakaensis]|uniref:uncharacterized protein n=1 Tax=Aspergillus karnatakaensis TaxID=1810916 RepID=UPI003CCCA158
MATLNALKESLRAKAAETAISAPTRQPLSDTQYSDAFRLFTEGEAWKTYTDFIIAQLREQVSSLLASRTIISVLEIGPGPKSVLEYLPYNQRGSIRRYIAYEPNTLFADRLEIWLRSASDEGESPLPGLDTPYDVRRVPFELSYNTTGLERQFDLILFCHSMYGMKPKESVLKHALGMLVERPDSGRIVIFHRADCLRFDGYVCHKTASFPTGLLTVPDTDEALDCFAPFVAGFAVQDDAAGRSIRAEWRKTCREMSSDDGPDSGPTSLAFSNANVMTTFTRHPTSLRDQNRQARRHWPAAVVRPTGIKHIQECVKWALKNETTLTIIGGGHSGHCLISNVVAIDMSAFDGLHIIDRREYGDKGDIDSHAQSLVVVEAGCTTGDILRKTMAAGLAVPLGSRPSVGAGLWLQGGLGHLARLYGLSCDSIIGAVLISVKTSQVFCIGCVPSQHQPPDSMRPDNEAELLWAIKGAGTAFGIVVSVTFQAEPNPTYLVRNWIAPMDYCTEARIVLDVRLNDFQNMIARKLPCNASADAYLYHEHGRLHLGVTVIECYTKDYVQSDVTLSAERAFLGQNEHRCLTDSVGLFEAGMYMSGMHGEHGGGKSSSFKRCLLVAAVENRPSPFCYLHLLHGGGAVSKVLPEETAFGCRDWEYACVITGVWSRDQDSCEIARDAEKWVYDVASDLLPFSVGVYSADLGPDPRDAILARRAFGANMVRLVQLKNTLDPHRVLAYTCPFPKTPNAMTISLVTGKCGAGKDYCAGIWKSFFTNQGLKAHVVSIGDSTKREYAAAVGADFGQLIENFPDVLYEASDVEVLFITGMRDTALVASFAHLVPNSRLIDIRVVAGEDTSLRRRDLEIKMEGDEYSDTGLDGYQPCFVFHNDAAGNQAAVTFAKHTLRPFFKSDLHRLAGMVRVVPDFPQHGIVFRHILNIVQHPGGLSLCVSLLKTHFSGDWSMIDSIVSCEVGGLIFASALCPLVNQPLAIIRDAGKLPPPTVAVPKPRSHISFAATNSNGESRIEMDAGLIPPGASVVVIDDVLATGQTLLAVLQLLQIAGVEAENISVFVVAEFPYHRGRYLLQQRGFGRVRVQSLLVLGGA